MIRITIDEKGYLMAKANALTLKNPSLCLEWHPTLNESLQPAMVTHGSVKKVWWQCKLGHEWEARIDNRHKGAGCPYCAGNKCLPGVGSFAALNPEALKEWDYTKNITVDPTQIIPTSLQKVWWKCLAWGHEWETYPKNRHAGYGGCHVCTGITIEKGFNDVATTHPYLMSEWDTERNDSIVKPYEVSYGSHKKVNWVCSTCNNKWIASINKRSSGKGCPNCSTGKTEKAFITELTNQSGYKFESSFVIATRRLFKRDRIQVDGLCEELKFAFEYDGEWTHGPNNPQGKTYQERLDEDADTTEALLNAGYKVIRVREEPLEDVRIDRAMLYELQFDSNLSQYRYTGKFASIKSLVEEILGDILLSS